MSLPFLRTQSSDAGAARTARAFLALFLLLFSSAVTLADPGDSEAREPKTAQASSTEAPAAAASACVEDSFTLCLQGNRFRVQGTFLLQNNLGSGPLPMTKRTDASGTFTFNDASDVQAVVKVLNACSFNNRLWVFIGPLTNQQVTLNITDMKTGVVKVYFNPLGTPFQPVQDIDAFATCP